MAPATLRPWALLPGGLEVRSSKLQARSQARIRGGLAGRWRGRMFMFFSAGAQADIGLRALRAFRAGRMWVLGQSSAGVLVECPRRSPLACSCAQRCHPGLPRWCGDKYMHG